MLEQQLAAARAFFRAGNLERAQDICIQILGADASHFGAFDCFCDILWEKGDLRGATRMCEWRLRSHPACADTHLTYLLLLGKLHNKDKAEHLVKTFRASHTGRPHILMEVNIIYSHFFDRPKTTLKLIRQARDTAALLTPWLDYFEYLTRQEAGHVFRRRQLLEVRQIRDPENIEILQELAEVNFLTLRPFKARHQARQLAYLDPIRKGRHKVFHAMTLASLCPLLWGAQFMAFFKAVIMDRFGVLGLLSLIFIGLGLAAAVQLAVLLPLKFVSLALFEAGKNTSLVLNIIWTGVLLYAFDFMDMELAGDKKTIKLSRDY